MDKYLWFYDKNNPNLSNSDFSKILYPWLSNDKGFDPSFRISKS